MTYYISNKNRSPCMWNFLFFISWRRIKEKKQNNMKNLVTNMDLILENYQLNFGKLSDLCIDKVRKNSDDFWKRYIVDFFICNFIISPCLISFWRGTWDYSIIYMDHWAFHVSILHCSNSKCYNKIYILCTYKYN